MKSMRTGLAGLFMVVGLLWAAPASAQVDVSGTWQLAVTTDQGVTHPTVTFRQEGADLTGDYSSEALGQNRVSGTVDGTSVTWSFSATLQGQDIPVRYRGTLQDDGTISGSIDIAGGMLTGSFVGTRDDR